jgi:hypothetical protein
MFTSFNYDLSAVTVDDIVGYRQSQTNPLPDRFGGKEGIPNLF